MRPAVIALFLAAACGGAASQAPDLSIAADASVAVDLTTAGAPTYAGFAKAFFASYCTSCHPSVSSTRDFTQLAVIMQNAHDIACGVSPTALAGCSGNPAPAQFPIGNGPFPTDAGRDELVAWVNGGLVP